MYGSGKRTHVYYPASLNELLHLYRRKPHALIYAGGTYILKHSPDHRLSLPREVISLHEIDELQRISRSERHLEIGAAVPIGTILKIGTNILPPLFFEALSSIGPPGIASLATLGGNLSVSGPILTVLPVLNVLDARIELRRQGHSRWIPASRFRDASGNPVTEPGEIVTRIRLPVETWNIQVFRKFGKLYQPDTDPLIFCGLAKTNKGILDDFRLITSTSGPVPTRNRELEAELVGRKLPLNRRETGAFVKGMSATMDGGDTLYSPLQQHRAIHLIRWFVNRLDETPNF